MSLGLALSIRADSQVGAAREQRVRDSALNLAEAALNAQVATLGQAQGWPVASTGAMPVCVPSTTNPKCPAPASLAQGYAGVDYTAAPSCPAGTPAQPWTTTVNDNTNG